ncbi:MAG: hypothetical protein QW806_01545 [Nitrososphaerota archaeon]
MKEITLEEILNKKIMIIGEVKSGKTRLTAKILEELVNKIDPKNITVIDMAPTTITGIGERISAYTNIVSKIRYLAPSIIRAPRIEGKNKEEVIFLANLNKNSIEPLIEHFLNKPTRILIINDLSIYFHAGSIDKILKCMDTSETFITNAYYGYSLSNDKNSGITEREKKLIEELIKNIDIVIKL